MRATGLFWAHVGDVPDGMRVQVWLDSDGARVRGSYSAIPFTVEVEGRVVSADAVALSFFEHGVARAIASRTRSATLRWSSDGSQLAGVDGSGARIELVRAAFVPPALRPGLWIARWTGLPFGMAVETRITRSGDGRWRAAYQYQGTGGVRDGSFEGSVDGTGVLEIVWTEIVAGRQDVSRGRGRLSPGVFGLRGTFGIDGSTEGTGEWFLEPISP